MAWRGQNFLTNNNKCACERERGKRRRGSKGDLVIYEWASRRGKISFIFDIAKVVIEADLREEGHAHEGAPRAPRERPAKAVSV